METLCKDEYHSEIIDGKTITMYPLPGTNHGRIVGNLNCALYSCLKNASSEIFSCGVSLCLDEENILVPDVIIVCDKSLVKEDGIYGAPDLVVEVLSPLTAVRDKGVKKDLYEKIGVKEYWIVSPGDKSIDVFQLEGGKFKLDNVYSLYPDWLWKKMTEEQKAAASLPIRVSLYEDFVIDVREIFEDVD